MAGSVMMTSFAPVSRMASDSSAKPQMTGTPSNSAGAAASAPVSTTPMTL